MLALVAGVVVLLVLLGGAEGLSRARAASLKMLLAWLGAGIGLAAVLFLALTGRVTAVLPALVLFAPLLWQRFVGMPGGGASNGGTRPAPTTRMTRADALAVLGLTGNPGDAEIREAWVRVMRGAHPDNGGSDWLAARVNMARDVLLRRR